VIYMILISVLHYLSLKGMMFNMLLKCEIHVLMLFMGQVMSDLNADLKYVIEM